MRRVSRLLGGKVKSQQQAESSRLPTGMSWERLRSDRGEQERTKMTRYEEEAEEEVR
jgi:hypothetical protein